MKKVAYQEYLIKHDALPEYVENIRRKCFVCGKVHLMLGGISLVRMESVNYKKTQYLISRHAPVGCWLAHGKKYIDDFYKDKDYHGWKNVKKTRKIFKIKKHNRR